MWNNRPARLELFGPDYAFKDKAAMEWPKYEYDYLALSSQEIQAPKILRAEKRDFLTVSGDGAAMQGIVTQVETQEGQTKLQYTPLLGVLDIDVYCAAGEQGPITVEEFLAGLIAEQFIHNPDAAENIPGLSVECATRTRGPLGIEEDIVNIYDVAVQAMRLYRIAVTMTLDAQHHRILCTVGQARAKQKTVECRLKNVLSSVVVSKKSRVSYNKIVIIGHYRESDPRHGQVERRVFYQDAIDGSVTQEPKARVLPVISTTLSMSVSDEFEEKAYEKAYRQIYKKEYDNYIKLEVGNKDAMLSPEGMEMGQQACILKDGVAYPSIYTGFKRADTTTLYFGLIRTEYSKQLRSQGAGRQTKQAAAGATGKTGPPGPKGEKGEPGELTGGRRARGPEKVLLYYGYPIAINGAWSTANAVNIYQTYDICIFGDGYELPEHDAHEDTVTIFNRMKEQAPETKLVGYVPIGAVPGSAASNLSTRQIFTRIDQWADMGADGIFLDEFGYDYRVTRSRQNEIVLYCHNRGLFVFANSWSLEYVFNPDPITLDWLPGFAPNPNGLASCVNSDDYFLCENLFFTVDGNTKRLTCSSVWRLDDVLGYFTRPRIEGRTYYESYGTKLCSLDAIPSTLGDAQKNMLQSLAYFGSAILNMSAVAFGDENWGAGGYFRPWDLPDMDLSHDRPNGVTVETKSYTDQAGEPHDFPYRWSASINGHTYAITFDVPAPDYEPWVDGMRYASMDGEVVEDAWKNIFTFQGTVRRATETAQSAMTDAAQAKQAVDEAMPAIREAEENVRQTVARAETSIAEAEKKLEAGLADLVMVTAGFGFKEIQW